MKTSNERGVALIMTLILMGVMSVMAVSLLFVSQSETWSSMNYRRMSQARDGAEGAVHKTVNFLIYSYTAPTSMTGYTTTVSPVTITAGTVAGVYSTNSNPPVTLALPSGEAAVQTSFGTAGEGTLGATVGDIHTSVNYNSFARLLYMRLVNKAAVQGGGSEAIQTWEITGVGSVSGVQNSQVEVTATLERTSTPIFVYAAFGTNDQCGTLNWHGNSSTTGSYDSGNVAGGIQTYGGNVGTNGNLVEAGGATVYGSLSTPRTGVGTCSAGNVTACTPSPCNTQGIYPLPQLVTYPPPPVPTPTPPTTSEGISNDGQCTSTTGCNTTGTSDHYRLNPTCADTDGACAAGSTPTYGNLSLQAGKTFHLCAGTYSMNSISLSGNAELVIHSTPNATYGCTGTGPVILNVNGASLSGTNPKAIDFSGGSISNSGLNPTNFQIMYAGTAEVKLTGGSATAALVYAPNAAINFSGGGAFYGSVIGKTVDNGGGADIYYDRQLESSAENVSPYMLSSFTWKKF